MSGGGHRPYRHPTPEEELAIAEGHSYYYMRKNFGVFQGTYERWKHEAAHAGENPDVRGLCELPPGDTPAKDDRESWRNLIRTTASHTKAKRGVDKDVTELRRHLGNKPVGLFLTSDWHVGSDAVNLDHILADAEYVGDFRRAYPGALQLAHLGDPIDGYILGLGGASGGLGEAAEPRLDRQEGMFLELARTMAGWPPSGSEEISDAYRWLVLLLGCHQAWTLTKGFRDPMTPLAKELGAANGGYGVVLVAQVGEVQYRGVLRHRTRRESQLNTTNAQRAIDDDTGIDEFGHRADFVSLSHLHNNDLQVRVKSGRPVVYTRSGAYKGGDCFARSINATMHKEADEGSPLLILYPDRRRVVPFSGLHWKEGLDFLAAAQSTA